MSRWREHSVVVIERTLAALPADATTAEKRKAVSAAYPFGMRKYHPYKTWCAAVRQMLGKAPTKTMALESPEYEVSVTWNIMIRVRCPFCDGSRCEIETAEFANGFCCAEFTDALRGWWNHQEFKGLFVTANSRFAEEPITVGSIGDWLMDHGECLGLADAFHEAWERASK